MAPAMPSTGHSIASDSTTGFLLVSTYSWTLITLGTVIVRFVQGVILRKVEMGLDDAAIIAASVFYLGATISWQYAINGGLGKELDTLSDEKMALLFKAFYIASLLGVVAMAFAKLSATFLIDRVTPLSRRSKMILFPTIAAWAIFALFARAFECTEPHWNPQLMKCGHGGVLITVIVTNIITDLMLAFWIIPTVWELNIARELRIFATVLFGTRAFVPIVAGGQIWAAAKVDRDSDPSHAFRELALLTQAVTSMSIIVASIPRIKRCFAIGGSPIAVAEVQPTEIPIIRSQMSGRSPNIEPKLDLSDAGKPVVTTTSKKPRAKNLSLPKVPEWQGMVSMGSKEDEHTSQSSLFDHDESQAVILPSEMIASAKERAAVRAAEAAEREGH